VFDVAPEVGRAGLVARTVPDTRHSLDWRLGDLAECMRDDPAPLTRSPL
jgi:hypothetical protein